METDVMLSVIMPVYNHEKYVAKAIESVIAQETNFKYELIIGEDKSTDNSLKIIREYERMHPDKIRVLAREENMGASKNGYDLYMNARGKYIATLEGDDYWLGTEKLQRQVDFLEENPDYIACAHRFKVVNQDEEEYYDRDFECQFFQNNPYTKEVLEKGLMLSHINSLVFRNIFKDESINTDLWREFDVPAGDYAVTALLILNGKMHFLDKCYSCYRKIISDVASSFSAMQERNNKRDILFKSTIELEEFLNRNYKFDCVERKKSTFASAVFKWYREKNDKNLKVVLNIIKYSKQQFRYITWGIYLVSCRAMLDLTGRRKERVKF